MRGNGKWAIFVAGLAAFSCSTFCISSGASTVQRSSSKSLLQQGLAYYQGKTITYVVPASAGAGVDLESRIVAPALGTYLHATVNILDDNDGLGYPAQDMVAHAVPNGLTIGLLQLTGDINNDIEDQPALDFNPAKITMLGGPGNVNAIYLTSPSSPYKNFGDLISDSASNPPTMLLQAVSSTNTLTRLLTKSFGISDKINYGYSSVGAILTGFLRGDGNFVSGAASQAVPLLTGNQAIAVAQGKKEHPGQDGYTVLQDVPTVAALAKEYPPKTALEKRAYTLYNAINGVTSDSISAPAKTPAAEVAALRQGMYNVYHSATVIAALNTAGRSSSYESWQAEKSGFVTALNLVKPIQSLLGI